MSYQIDLTHAIGQIYYNGEGNVNWHLEYHFHGPDRRYNDKYEMIFLSGAIISIKNALNAFEKFKELVAHQKEDVYVSQSIGRFTISTYPSNYGIFYQKFDHYNSMFPISTEERLKSFFQNLRLINTKALILSLDESSKIKYPAFRKLREISDFISVNCNLGVDELLEKHSIELNEYEEKLKKQYEEKKKKKIVTFAIVLFVILLFYFIF